MNHFDVLVSKINFKNKKYYVNIFLIKNNLKNNFHHTSKHTQRSKVVKVVFGFCRRNEEPKIKMENKYVVSQF